MGETDTHKTLKVDRTEDCELSKDDVCRSGHVDTEGTSDGGSGLRHSTPVVKAGSGVQGQPLSYWGKGLGEVGRLGDGPWHVGGEALV